jgi:hypothetical protein
MVARARAMTSSHARRVPTEQDTEAKTRARKRLMRVGFVAGAVLALVCHCVPAEYKATCQTVAEITTLSCGGHP